jgi:homoserine dehydrogenase
MERRIGIAIVGCGVVGSGTVELLRRHRAAIEERAGAALDLKYVVVRDPTKVRSVFLDDSRVISDVCVALHDPDVHIVVELVGGTGVAHSVVRDALGAGKCVVTANKALLAEKGDELFALAERMGVALAFEASVCGGIPIVRTLCEGLAGDHVQAICGVLNGTTNFILTRMSEGDLDFPEALALAQQRGLAEADPSLDVGGHDAAHKLAILASLAFRTVVSCDAVFRQGIAELQLQDVHYARELGYAVKLLGMARLVGSGRIDARVHPVLIPRDHPLATVREEFNAVMVDSDFLGPSFYQGKGAGAHPTASAVVGDIVSLARQMKGPLHGCTPLRSRQLSVMPMDEVECRYFMRCQVADRPGVLHAISEAFARRNIGIASVIQKGRDTKGNRVPLVITTHRACERDVQAALAAVRMIEIAAVSNASLLRILDDEVEDEGQACEATWVAA